MTKKHHQVSGSPDRRNPDFQWLVGDVIRSKFSIFNFIHSMKYECLCHSSCGNIHVRHLGITRSQPTDQCLCSQSYLFLQYEIGVTAIYKLSLYTLILLNAVTGILLARLASPDNVSGSSCPNLAPAGGLHIILGDKRILYYSKVYHTNAIPS